MQIRPLSKLIIIIIILLVLIGIILVRADYMIDLIDRQMPLIGLQYNDLNSTLV